MVFFNIDVLAGIAGVYHLQAMPVIRRADNDGIDIPVVEEFAVINIGARCVTVQFGQSLNTFSRTPWSTSPSAMQRTGGIQH